jgi:hypothetical protein
MITAALMAITTVGLLMSRPWASDRTQSRVSPSAATHPAFAATGGPFCPQSSAVTTYEYNDPHGDGWHRASSPGGVCGKYFLYTRLARVPGDPYQWQEDYDWTFNTGLAAPHCTLHFYIPVSAHADSPVFYWISTGSQNIGNEIASFTINQRANRGRWLTRGPFAFPGGTVFLELTDQGEGPPTADAVAAAVRLTC